MRKTVRSEAVQDLFIHLLTNGSTLLLADVGEIQEPVETVEHGPAVTQGPAKTERSSVGVHEPRSRDEVDVVGGFGSDRRRLEVWHVAQVGDAGDCPERNTESLELLVRCPHGKGESPAGSQQASRFGENRLWVGNVVQAEPHRDCVDGAIGSVKRCGVADLEGHVRVPVARMGHHLRRQIDACNHSATVQRRSDERPGSSTDVEQLGAYTDPGKVEQY